MRNVHDGQGLLPMGFAVDVARVQKPQHTTLSGKLISLVPVDVQAHAKALYENLHGPESNRVWHYIAEGPYGDFSSFEQRLSQLAKTVDPLLFTILDNASGNAVGIVAYLRIDLIHRTMEVGNILYTPAFQRTSGATEAMYLMARHVFEDLGFRRYEWKCDVLNERSRRAALRLGFTFEGIFRQHMIIKGRNRDTAWYSMLDVEWPLRKAAFERWLQPSNCDSAGQQKQSLSDLTFRASKLGRSAPLRD